MITWPKEKYCTLQLTNKQERRMLLFFLEKKKGRKSSMIYYPLCWFALMRANMNTLRHKLKYITQFFKNVFANQINTYVHFSQMFLKFDSSYNRCIICALIRSTGYRNQISTIGMYEIFFLVCFFSCFFLLIFIDLFYYFFGFEKGRFFKC